MNPSCPLCGSAKNFTVRAFDLGALRAEWLGTFGFDAFSEFQTPAQSLRQHRCGACDLEYFSPEYTGGPAFYEKLSQGDWYYEENKWEFDEAIRRLGRNPQVKSLLEIGCGNGHFLEKVASGCEAFGIEINEEATRACKAKNLDVTTTRLEKVGRQYDAVVAFEVLEHIPQPADFLRQIVRVLAPGGTLIVAVPNPDSYLRELDHLILDMPPHHATHWSKSTFEFTAREFGLQLIGTANEPLRYVHYQSYLATLAGRRNRLEGSSPRKRLRRLLDWMISPILEKTLAPLFYQYHKQMLLGQTHLAEFRKP